MVKAFNKILNLFKRRDAYNQFNCLAASGDLICMRTEVSIVHFSCHFSLAFLKCGRSLSPYFAGLRATYECDICPVHVNYTVHHTASIYLPFDLNVLFFKSFVFGVSWVQWLGKRSSYCPCRCCVKRRHHSWKHILPFYCLISLINTDKKDISLHTELNKWIKMSWEDSADSWIPFVSLEIDTCSDSIHSEIAKWNNRSYFLHRGNSALRFYDVHLT